MSSPATSVKIQNGFKIRGIEPPDLKDYDPSIRKLYWSWVLELTLKRKDKELSQGLDKDGKPLRPISEETRRNRRSAMTPSGRGDPSAPPLTPGLQKSRTRSLLSGRAFTTHCALFWLYDAWTGASWAEVLDQQAKRGRDVFGLSPAGVRWVRNQASVKWERFKKTGAGAAHEPIAREAVSVPKGPRIKAQNVDVGVSSAGEIAIGARYARFSTPEMREVFFRQTAQATIPGRAARPKSGSTIVGADYNLLLRHVWGTLEPGRGGGGLPSIPGADRLRLPRQRLPAATAPPKKPGILLPGGRGYREPGTIGPLQIKRQGPKPAAATIPAPSPATTTTATTLAAPPATFVAEVLQAVQGVAFELLVDGDKARIADVFEVFRASVRNFRREQAGARITRARFEVFIAAEPLLRPHLVTVEGVTYFRVAP